MQDIFAFLSELRTNTGAIWLDNNKIKFSAPKKFQNKETDNLIISNKDKFISILQENKVFSKEQFLNTTIWKDRTALHYPLSPAQERLWFIEQYEQGTNAYNIPIVSELAEGTDIEGIRYALSKIMQRHEVLRSTIEQDDQQQGIQVLHHEPLNTGLVLLADEKELNAVITEDINLPFNLATEYPIRTRFYQLENGRKTLLLINTHHIASDGWSS
ncbi:condensation domain-containing protein, partial [Pedobacter sp. KBW06]|uniref:condensation domain-containing protein n=1 Tax=Pedobacter sp. KBW06 TaxID=2153359 RepID=UPI0013153A35